MKNLLETPLKRNFYIFFAVTMVCYGYSMFIGYQQYKVWKATPTKYFVEQTPMMTTLDSYIWIRLAKEYKENGSIAKGKDLLRYFPDGKNKKYPTPPISYLISKVATLYDHNYYRAGFFLMMALSGAFIFPLAYYFYLTGYPIAGILGGLIGTVSYEYLIRTGVGRIDTDSLMLFFMFSVSVFILKASLARNLFHIFIYSGVGGAFAYLLTLWWGKSAYTIPFLAILFLSLLLHLPNLSQKLVTNPRVIIKNLRLPLYNKLIISLLASMVFFASAIGTNISDLSPGEQLRTVSHYIGNYVQLSDEPVLPSGDNVAIPNVLKTIKETKTLPVKTTLGHLTTSPTLSAVGLVGFLIFFFFHWKKLLPVLLIFIIGLLAFQGARRFAMFLGPFVGIGYGYLLTIILGQAYQYISPIKTIFSWCSTSKFFQCVLKRASNSVSTLKELSYYVIALALFFGLSSYTAVGRIPRPSIPTSTFLTFLELKDSLPKGSAIYTWWDYGYALTDVMEVATFHDGGSQTSAKTFFIAKSLTSDRPTTLHNTISHLTSKGMERINRMIDASVPHKEFVSNVLTSPSILDHERVYLMFTQDQIQKFRTIHSIGQWNFEKEQLGPRIGYKTLNCNHLTEFHLECRKGIIDLTTGSTYDGGSLKSALIIDNGYIKTRVRYSNNHGKYLQVLIKDEIILAVQILDREVFYSNFNQMYLLGQYDHNLFDEVYNSFPWSRVFHVRPPTIPVINRPRSGP